MPPTSTPTSSEKRMSKLRTCDSSLPRTPWSSSRFIALSRPVVIAIEEWFGSRPVANAFIASSWMTYTAGTRVPAGDRQLADDVIERGRLPLADGLGRRGRQDELVAHEIRADRAQPTDHDRDQDGADHAH